jgi:hypothetical protein
MPASGHANTYTQALGEVWVYSYDSIRQRKFAEPC